MIYVLFLIFNYTYLYNVNPNYSTYLIQIKYVLGNEFNVELYLQ